MTNLEKIKMLILPPFEYWLKTSKRTKIAFGGRGGGKSESIARMLIFKSFELNGVILCARETQKSISYSIHPILSSIINEHGLNQYFDITHDKIINTTTGCRFLFIGLKEYSVDNIKSISNVNICFIEEGQTVSKYSNDILRPSIRADKSEIWWAFNPRYEYDVIYDFIKNYKLENKTYSAYKNGVYTEYPYQTYEDEELLIYKINFDGNFFFSEVLETERQFTLKHNSRDYSHIWLGDVIKELGTIFLKDKIKYYDDNDIQIQQLLSTYNNYCLIDPAFGSENCYTSAIIYKKVGLFYYLIDSGLMKSDNVRTTDEMLTDFMKSYDVKKVFIEANFSQKELALRLQRQFKNVNTFYQRINKIERIVNASYDIFDKVLFPESWREPPDFQDMDKWTETVKGRGFIALQQLFNFSDDKKENCKKDDNFSYIDFPDALASIVMFDPISNDNELKLQRIKNNLTYEDLFDSINKNTEYDFNRSII